MELVGISLVYSGGAHFLLYTATTTSGKQLPSINKSIIHEFTHKSCRLASTSVSKR